MAWAPRTSRLLPASMLASCLLSLRSFCSSIAGQLMQLAFGQGTWNRSHVTRASSVKREHCNVGEGRLITDQEVLVTDIFSSSYTLRLITDQEVLEPKKAETVADFINCLVDKNRSDHRCIERTIKWVCLHAKGGIIVAMGNYADFKRMEWQGAIFRASDDGYMTNRLQGVHIEHNGDCFVRALIEYTEHTHDDRWGQDHPDASARGKPKDGAWIIDTLQGRCVGAAIKILGLRPPYHWKGVGTRHDCAQSVAWAASGSIVCVRSDNGRIHGLVRRGCELKVYELSTLSSDTKLG